MSAEGQILWKQNQIIITKQTTDFSINYRGKLINLVAVIDPIHINNVEEKQNAPLPEFNANVGSFDCLPFTQPLLMASNN